MSSDGVKPLEHQAIIATDLTKWFGEGETKKIAVNAVGFIAHFGAILFIVGPCSVEQSADGHEPPDAADNGERPVDQSIGRWPGCFA